MKELMLIKISGCVGKDIEEIFRISQIFDTTVVDYGWDAVLIESVNAEDHNNSLIVLLGKCFANRIEIVRGGSVAVEAFSSLADSNIAQSFSGKKRLCTVKQ